MSVVWAAQPCSFIVNACLGAEREGDLIETGFGDRQRRAAGTSTSSMTTSVVGSFK
ncbi:hypothetical protein [Paraburkholderia sp. RL18-085-BIA-A]|uniref:hypothetical protein n=1 Tax=Paraburkholderia sp. RL18-085-BIA-A TaxID=3031633 RepID=UPI0038B84548